MLNNPRVPAFIEALRQAIQLLFQRATPGKEETWMPYEMLPVSAFDLKKANTVDEFREALLVRSRLGKLMLLRAEGPWSPLPLCTQRRGRRRRTP